MARKNYFLIVDTETTQPLGDQKPMVADFGALVCDRKGRIHASCGVLVAGIYDQPDKFPLFYTSNPDDALWGRPTLDKRYTRYNEMLENGERMLSSVAAINRWLARAAAKFDPVLTAYNLAFDVDKMRNTGIDYGMFSRSFCLWHAAADRFAFTPAYKRFVFDHKCFGAVTPLGNWAYQTKAEVMARFLLGAHLPDEPHTALEDARDYELPILQAVAKGRKLADVITPPPFNWRDVQMVDHFEPNANQRVRQRKQEG